MINKENKKFIIVLLLIASALLLSIIYIPQIKSILLLIWKVTFPLILGFIFAYILNLLVVKIENKFKLLHKEKVKKFARPISILLSILSIFLIFFIIINIILPQLIETLSIFTSNFPKIINTIDEWVNLNQDKFPLVADYIDQLNIDWNSIGKTITAFAISSVTALLNSSFGLATNFFSGLFNLFMSISFAIYLLVGKEKLLKQAKNFQKAYFKENIATKLNNVFTVANNSFSSYITGQCLEAVVLGTLCTLGMLLFRFPFALTIGVFIGTTALIPIVGAFLGATVGALLILTVSPVQALLFIAYIIVLQQLENNLIYPKVVGTSVGLPGIWILASVTIGGGLFGIVGMIIGVPITATIYKLLQNDIRSKLNKPINIVDTEN